MSKVKRIILTGADGSGKTTSLKYLILYFEKSNIRYRVFWIKSLHTVAYIIFAIVNQLVYSKKFKLQIYQPWTKRLGIIWLIIEVLGLIPYLILIKIYERKNNIIIFDRFLIDFCVTVSLRTNPKLLPKIVYILYPIMKNLILDNTLIIYHRIPISHYLIVLTRKNQLETTLSDYRKMIILYDIIIHYMVSIGANILEVNSLNPIEENRKKIIKVVMNYVRN